MFSALSGLMSTRSLFLGGIDMVRNFGGRLAGVTLLRSYADAGRGSGWAGCRPAINEVL